MSSRGGAARKVTDVGAHPTWSPDGRRIAFQSRQPADLNPGGSFGAESTIWVADVDGRTPPTALTTPGRPLGSHGMPQWWPGSERVAFAVSAPSGVFLGAALWTVEARTGEFSRLSAHSRLSAEFTVAPDGRGVVFVGRNTTALWWLPVDGTLQAGEPRPTALSVSGTSLASLAISPDARRIAWTAFASNSGITSHVIGPSAGMAISPGFAHLAVAFIRDGVPTCGPPTWVRAGRRARSSSAPSGTSNGAFASWSPDGRWIAYQCSRGGSIQICLIDATAPPPAPVRQLTLDAGTNFNGEWIDNDALLVAGQRAAVWNVLRISRSGAVTPLTAFVEPRFYVRYPRWDAVGRRIVFERYEMAGRLWSLQLPALSAAGSPGSGAGH